MVHCDKYLKTLPPVSKMVWATVRHFCSGTFAHVCLGSAANFTSHFFSKTCWHLRSFTVWHCFFWTVCKNRALFCLKLLKVASVATHDNENSWSWKGQSALTHQNDHLALTFCLGFDYGLALVFLVWGALLVVGRLALLLIHGVALSLSFCHVVSGTLLLLDHVAALNLPKLRQSWQSEKNLNYDEEMWKWHQDKKKTF